ncbi:MAG: VanZ family protein, partial [Ruminiclostridium sp.]
SRVLFSDYDKMQPEQQSFIVEGLQHFVRKFAHFSVYMLLGLFSYAATLLSFEKLRYKWLLAIIVCVFYAAVDEIHQLFVPGRTAKITDVLIDGAGSIMGMLILRIAILCWIYFKSLINNHNK